MTSIELKNARSKLNGANVEWTDRHKRKHVKSVGVVARVSSKFGRIVCDIASVGPRRVYWEDMPIHFLTILKTGTIAARDRAREKIGEIKDNRSREDQIRLAVRMALLERHGLFSLEDGHLDDEAEVEVRVKNDRGTKWITARWGGYTSSGNCRVRFTWNKAGAWQYPSPLHVRAVGCDNQCDSDEWAKLREEMEAIADRPQSGDPEPDMATVAESVEPEVEEPPELTEGFLDKLREGLE